MKLVVFVPVGMQVPTPLARRPNSFTNDVIHTCAVFPCMRCIYYNDAPVSGSITEFTACVCKRILDVREFSNAVVPCGDSVAISRLVVCCWRLWHVG